MSYSSFPSDQQGGSTPDPFRPVLEGMGAIPHPRGVAFRVWAPNARQVAVTGSFNDWGKRDSLQHEGNGYWYGDVSAARPGDEYRFVVETDKGAFSRNDPCARQLTPAKTNGVVLDPKPEPAPGGTVLAPWNELVVYEMHVGTFHRPAGASTGTFDSAIERLDHLVELGVNAIEVMPIAVFCGERSWGYNPSHVYAVDPTYGGPAGFRRFVHEAHRRRLAVILDVVLNHLGPEGLDLWQFDGWNENGLGGIYFYNDWRAATPWGHTRPDFGRPAVRDFLRDSALMWLENYQIDGLRFDATFAMRAAVPNEAACLPDGVELLRGINHEIRRRFPDRITIAEDLQDNESLTSRSGMNFGSQWDARFVNVVRDVVRQPSDEGRSMAALADALGHRFNGDAFQRVVYTESHDDVANGKARVPAEIHPGDPGGWFARKRSTLAAGLLFTAPGIPMLFQGQEMLEAAPFDDSRPLDWRKSQDESGIVALYRDLVRLRLNRGGSSRGLCGQHVNVFHANEGTKVLAYHRWDRGGPGDDVVVVANFRSSAQNSYRIGFPTSGRWRLLLNTDWRGYSATFGDTPSGDITAHPGDRDGLPAHGEVRVGPYSVLVFARG